MEPAGVPAIIAYRGGDKFAGLVPVIDEIPDDAELSALTLETVMKRYVLIIPFEGMSSGLTVSRHQILI